MNPPNPADEPDPRGPLPPHEDPLDHLVTLVSDGAPVDLSSEEFDALATRFGDRARALLDVAKIAAFSRALQRRGNEAGGVVDEASPLPRWGSFTFLERLGSGAAGEVWRAWDGSLEREVAIKFLLSKDATAEERSDRALLAEARALARVRHPGVATVFGIAEHEGRVGLWMELLRGPTLAETIQRKAPLSVRDVIRFGVKLCDALDALDQAGIVHRDIKPSNIILESGGRAVLTDFGLGSRRRLFETASPRDGSGTPLFMAPSLLEGGPATPRTDLYALGVTLRWALTGRPPFDASTMEELRAEVVRGPSTPLARERPDAPPALVRAIEKAMDGSPQAPLYTAAGMRRDLGEVAAQPSLDTAGPAADPPRDRPSVAVLPFLNRSQDPSEEYFSDGLADELLTVLSKIGGLHVAARTSAFQFKGKNEDLATIGRKLRVATILEGSVRRSGGRMRVAVRLVNAEDGSQIWSESYDRPIDDLFDVQDDIARSVAQELRAALLGTSKPPDDLLRREVEDAVRGRSRDPEAHRLYLEGRYHLLRRNRDDLALALERLRASVARDPRSALAWAELGHATAEEADHGLAPADEAYRRAREMIQRALDLEPDLSEAYARLARIQVVRDWDWPAAEASFLRAIDRGPGNVSAIHGAAVLLQALGRTDEAIALNKRAVDMDPLNAPSIHNLGCVYYEAGRFEEAEAALRQAIAAQDKRHVTHSVLAQVLEEMGRSEEALEEAHRETDPTYRLLALALIHHREGHVKERDEALRQIEATSGENEPVQVAEAYGSCGMADAAFAWLTRASKTRDSALVHIKPNPHFRSIRSDPRWRALLKIIGMDAS
jgi:TolB-like protein/Tfp pilus assembly protein PilF